MSFSFIKNASFCLDESNVIYKLISVFSGGFLRHQTSVSLEESLW